jgi:hypothetical protein
VQMTAVKQDRKALDSIKRPTSAVIDLAFS